MSNIARVKELRGQYDQTVKRMREINDKAEAEKRGLTEAEQAEWDQADSGLAQLKGQIQRLERMLQLSTEGAGAGLASRGAFGAGGGDQSLDEIDDEDDPESDAGKARREQDAKFQRAFARAFSAYLRGGLDEVHPQLRTIFNRARAQMNPNEAHKLFRDLNVGTPAAGGYTVAQDFYNRLIEAQKAWGGMAEVAEIITTSTGATMPVPTETDVANVATIVGEGVASNTSVDATFNATNLGAYMYRTVVRVSLEMLQDSAFDVEGYVARKMGIRFGRGQNAHYTTGTGVGQPRGLLAATGGAATGKVGATGQTTSVLFNDLVDLEHSVDPSYRPTARWMFHDTVLRALKKLADTAGRPIWMPDYATSVGGAFPATLLGYGYTINQDMPQMAANAKSIAFGDFKSYFIRRVMNVMILRLTERFADNGQVGFIGFARADGTYINSGDPIKVYTNSAT